MRVETATAEYIAAEYPRATSLEKDLANDLLHARARIAELEAQLAEAKRDAYTEAVDVASQYEIQGRSAADVAETLLEWIDEMEDAAILRPIFAEAIAAKAEVGK
jgi:hypothetical protein